MSLRLSGLGAALLLAGALPAAHADAAGVLLRYHFTNGETITYNVTSTATVTGSEGGKPFPAGTDRQVYLVHYAFSHIAEGGGAILTMRTDRFTDHATQSGKTTNTVVPATTQQFLQQTDGRQYTPDLRAFGAYSNGDLGALPANPVAVGATWTTTLTDRGNIYKPNTAMTCTNTLTGVTPAPNRVATIQTTCSIKGHGNVKEQGRTYKFAASDTLSGHWQFSVTSGRFLSQVLHETTTQSGTVTDKKGTRPFTQKSVQTTIQKIGAAPAPPSSGPGTSV